MRSVEKKNRRRTIGADPLAAIIPIGAEQSETADPAVEMQPKEEPAPRKRRAEKATPAPTPETTPQKVLVEEAAPTSTVRTKKRTTLNMDAGLDDAIRDAVFALSGPATQMSLVRFVEDGLSAHLKELERKHNEGKPFPKRNGKLRTGRPLS